MAWACAGEAAVMASLKALTGLWVVQELPHVQLWGSRGIPGQQGDSFGAGTRHLELPGHAGWQWKGAVGHTGKHWGGLERQWHALG